MTTFGLTSAGFVQKRYADIISSLQAAEETAFGANILDKIASSVISQLNGVFANELAAVWQLGQDVYSNSYPATAGGTNLALLGLLTGVSPLQATQSWAGEVFVGTNATVIPTNTLCAVQGTLALFQPMVQLTIATVPAWVTATSYTGQSGTTATTAIMGSLVSKGGNIYYCTQSGISGATGPTGTSHSISDGTCVWSYVAAGSAAVAGVVQSQSFSPIPASANQLTILQTSLGGVTAITNPVTATLGSLAETDAAFRTRRAQLVRATGNATIAAITAKLAQVAGVTNVLLINNPTDAVVSGQPAHSFAPYVLGGAAQDIYNAIVQSQPAGIQSFGTTNGNGVDLLNNSQPAGYTVATQTNIYVAVTLTSGSSYSGGQSVKNAIAAYANATWGSIFGSKIIANLLYNPAYFGYGTAFPVTGVTEITALNIGTAPSPGSAADISIGSTAIALFNSANITVNGV